MTENYFFMFRRLQNNVTCFFYNQKIQTFLMKSSIYSDFPSISVTHQQINTHIHTHTHTHTHTSMIILYYNYHILAIHCHALWVLFDEILFDYQLMLFCESLSNALMFWKNV